MRKLFVLMSALLLSGCGVITPMTRSESKLSTIQIGQERKDVLSSLGKPDDIKSSEKLSNGDVVQVDEYRLFKPGTSLFNAVAGPFFLTATWWTPYLGDKFFDPYFVQYLNGKLDKVWKSDPSWTGVVTVKDR